MQKIIVILTKIIVKYKILHFSLSDNKHDNSTVSRTLFGQ